MIETVINLKGEEEKFDAKKLNHWVQDAVGFNADEWSSIALETVRDLPKKVTVQQLMQKLIDTLLSRETWSHYLMAGRLRAVLNRIEVFGSKELPTVRAVQEQLYESGLMRRLNYSEYEWAIIEAEINHDRDLTYPHFAMDQLRFKYALQDFSTKTEFESPQFIYMRMAMALFEENEETMPGYPLVNEDPSKRSRLEHVLRIYRHFSNKRLSAPTPNYNNLGTYHKGYASCCLIAVGDSRWSLAVGDHITYMMTTQSAGIGTNLMTRSIGDPVQKGRFLHRGKLPYIAAFGKNIRANLQGGRGGAGTMYFNLFDPEAKVIAGLRDTRASDTARNRDAHYAYMSNRFLTMKMAKDEEVFTWNIKTAPDLHEAFYGPDINLFAKIYEKYENDPNFKKTYTPARELVVHAVQQGIQTGTIYAASIDEMNRNTPFLDPIHSSNLCVAPGTIIVTKEYGHRAISEFHDRQVEVWNGFEWSRVTVRQTSKCEKLLRVYTSAGRGFLDCTAYHKWYVMENGVEVEKRTHELKPGMELAPFEHHEQPAINIHCQILDVEDLGVENSVFCFNEPKRHKAMFNGVVTGQCLEVSEPTEPYDGKNAMLDLYSSVEVGYVRALVVYPDGREAEVRYNASKILPKPGGGRIVAQTLKAGDHYIDWGHDELVVKKILAVKKEPEVALCSLAATNITEEMSDDEYRDVMYYAYKMIDYCILHNEYIMPHIGVTAKARMNAGVGMMGLATHMARKRLKFNSTEGLQELHRVFERHLYFAIEASLQISKERGLAPWIGRTKWPDGWTPLKSYRKEVDQLANFEYQYDWDEVSERIKANGGLAHSCLINFMPGESSSKALGATNSIYGIRELVLLKGDANNMLRWAAPYGDDPAYLYQRMWELTLPEQNSLYAIGQKFCDQSASADWYLDFTNRLEVSSTEIVEAELDRVKKGVKTRYYVNTLMPGSDDTMKISKSVHEIAPAIESAPGNLLGTSDELAGLEGITFQTEQTGGDGHMECEGCSL
ncbi:putative ribonucleotide reductase alpha subunit [Ralstonia phage RSF1]|uniref:Ribonucleoside-diphosphate reductase n=1 Tax=Ralstonia phage RSF1 TaxID=1689679 RepID=A0A0K2QQN7_9CAUD|nr:putative ribonucleotide reductase alpha subunit [Ralstonia phage RSF1]BAS04910.1 putative ribonucleotide reductase alpha subunit [Ralstonia phage RSF1]